MKIVLLGYMGSGKSTMGKELASVLNVDFIDLDEEIEKEEETAIDTLFKDKGEIYFRKKEQSTLNNLIAKPGNYIIATGGGTPCYGNMMQRLLEDKNVKTVYLKASIATLTKRLYKEKDSRPLISHLKTEELLNDFIRKHLFERNFYYLQAKHTITVDDKRIPTITEEIVATLF